MRYLAVSLVSLILLGGCSANTASISIDSGNQNVVVGDIALAQSLSFENAGIIINGSHPQAQVTITNLTTFTKNLQYRFNWYDSQGLEVDDETSPWRPIMLYGNETQILKAAPISPTVTNFRVSIRNLK